MLNPNERRSEILAVINVRRHDTIDNLAYEFNVSRRTIRYDIEALSLSSPIYTVSGRHGGGVYMMDGQYAGRKFLTVEQTELLHRLTERLDVGDLATMDTILKAFAAPEKGKRRI